MTDVQSINTNKHLPQSPFTGKNLLDDDILFWFLYSWLVHGERNVSDLGVFIVEKHEERGGEWKRKPCGTVQYRVYSLPYTVGLQNTDADM
jgi:hypothetical protein